MRGELLSGINVRKNIIAKGV